MTKLWRTNKLLPLLIVAVLALFAAACTAPVATDTPEATVESVSEGEPEGEHDDEHEDEHDDEHEGEHDDESLEALTLPELPVVALDGRPLRVVATTSIIGDVASRVGGQAIELTTLMGPGVDPHSYQPAARDLSDVVEADVVLVNGWNLEEGLVDDLANISGNGVPLVPVSAGLTPLAFGEDEDHHEGEHEDDEHEGEHEDDEHEGEHEHDHGAADPHTWLDVANVRAWAQTMANVFSALDPENAAVYEANAAAYDAELAALDTEIREQLATIPAERRVLVTNHDAFGYLAEAYGFEVLGTILPATSTIAEPTASDLADLVRAMQTEGVCTVFTETTVSDRLGQTVAAELETCETVQVLSLFSGALGGPGSGAETYADMMRANASLLVAGLRGG